MKLLIYFGRIMLVLKEEHKKDGHCQRVKRKRRPDALPVLAVIRVSIKLIDNNAADGTA